MKIFAETHRQLEYTNFQLKFEFFFVIHKSVFGLKYSLYSVFIELFQKVIFYYECLFYVTFKRDFKYFKYKLNLATFCLDLVQYPLNLVFIIWDIFKIFSAI